MKKVLVLMLVAVLLLSACGSESSESKGANETSNSSDTSGEQGDGASDESSSETAIEVKDVKIAMMIWESGPQQTATQNYCQALEEGIDGLSFVYGQLSATDEDANVAAAQAMIAQGVDGIIMYNQNLGLPTIAEIGKEAGVYVGCYLSKPGSDIIGLLEGNDYYIGSVMDGPLDTGEMGIYAAELAIENGYKHIGSVSFPLSVIEPMKDMVEAFYGRIEEFNAGAAAEEQITLYDNEEVWFTQVDASFFANYPEMDAVFGAGGGVLSVYPTMVSAGLTDTVKLISTGMLYDEDTIGAIESGKIQLATTSTVEQLFYPVAMIFNAVQGQTYADQPESWESVGCGVFYIRNKEDIDNIKAHSYLYAESYDEYDRLMLTPEEAKQLLLAYNPDATYEELTGYLDDLNLENLAGLGE